MGRPNKSQSNLSVTDTITKSAGLSERASQEWDRLVSELHKAGVKLSAFHRAPLTLAATIAADIASDWEEIQREGAYAVSVKGGIQAHPAVKRMDALRRDYAKVLAIIGLRAAVSTGSPAAETLEDVLGE